MFINRVYQKSAGATMKTMQASFSFVATGPVAGQSICCRANRKKSKAEINRQPYKAAQPDFGHSISKQQRTKNQPTNKLGRETRSTERSSLESICCRPLQSGHGTTQSHEPSQATWSNSSLKESTCSFRTFPASMVFLG